MCNIVRAFTDMACRCCASRALYSLSLDGHIAMCVIYLFFYRALKSPGFNHSNLPYKGWWQPYCAYFGLVTMIFNVSFYGYTTFLPGCKLLHFPLSFHPRPPLFIVCGMSTDRSSRWDLGTFSYTIQCAFYVRSCM